MSLIQSLNDLLRYRDEETVRNIAGQMTFRDWVGGHRKTDHTKRVVLADAYEEHTGDGVGAGLLRNPDQTVAFHKGKMHPGIIRHRDAAGEFGGDGEMMEAIDQMGPDDALVHALMNYDHGEGRLTEDTPWESGDRTHTSVDGFHTLAWNPRLDYWSLTEHHVLPESMADRDYMHGW